VIDKMMREAQRASEVVRRLRDFFRTGTTRLEQVPVGQLLEAARRNGAAMKGGGAIAFSVEVEQGLPVLFADRLQIELVLRNLVSNAVEAVDAHSPGRGHVAMAARREGAHHVRIVVADSGPGVPPATGPRVFEPFFSGKSSGMGLGLTVSRAIAEAHGGTLDTVAGARGEFHLVLPIEAPHA
jgi:signal transduction histidine kinase